MYDHIYHPTEMFWLVSFQLYQLFWRLALWFQGEQVLLDAYECTEDEYMTAANFCWSSILDQLTTF